MLLEPLCCTDAGEQEEEEEEVEVPLNARERELLTNCRRLCLRLLLLLPPLVLGPTPSRAPLWQPSFLTK